MTARPRQRSIRIGIDTGGTFTDVVAVDEDSGEMATTKTPSTPHDPAVGFMAGVHKVLDTLGLGGDSISAVSHGTTVATNKLLEGKVENLGFITTEGYEYVLEIARQSVPDGYGNSYFWVKPDRIVPAHRVKTVPGRLSVTGEEIRPFDEAAAVRHAARSAGRGHVGSVPGRTPGSSTERAHDMMRAPTIDFVSTSGSLTRRGTLPDLDTVLAPLAEPKDLTRPFDKLLAELLSKVTDDVVVAYAITLLDGDDPTRYPAALRHFGGAHADLLLDQSDMKMWPAVWGARALKYVWAQDQAAEATRLVVAHLNDPRWRVAEMCAKVVTKRELGEGADALVSLTGHRLSRVRMQAVRALGTVGETEHLEVIHQALRDEDRDVRRAAARALEQRASKLDLDYDDLMAGRFR